MQILQPFAGSIQRYLDEIADTDRYRPDHCPQCGAKHPLTGHGFYFRSLVDTAFDGVIRVRRYLCRSCKRTVSLLPEFVLPWLRFSISVIALFLVARLLNGLTLVAAAPAAAQPGMPYQRGQFWIRRFQKQAPALSLALVPLVTPSHPRDPAADFVSIALRMLEAIGWIAAPDYRPGHGGFPHEYQSRKTGPVSLRANRSAGNRNSSPRRTHAPGPGDRQPHLRHPPFETDGGFRRYTARLGAALPQRRFRSAGSQASPGPWTVARHQPATGQPHRTPEAREPASHRHDSVARTGFVFR